MLDEIGGAHKLQGWNRNILTGRSLVSFTLWDRGCGKSKRTECLMK